MNTTESQSHPVYTEDEVGAAYDAVLDAVRAAGMNPRLAYQSDDTGYIYEHGGKEYVLVLGLLDNAEVLDSSTQEQVRESTRCASCGADIAEYAQGIRLCVYCDPEVDTDA